MSGNPSFDEPTIVPYNPFTFVDLLAILVRTHSKVSQSAKIREKDE